MVLFLLTTRMEATRRTEKWRPDRPLTLSQQCPHAAAPSPQTSVLKPWYLGFLLFSPENILTKTVHAVVYKIVDFPDNEHLVDVLRVL